jgi:hypothetical protein
MLVESPDLAIKEQVTVMVNSEVVTAHATAVRTPGRLSSHHQRGKEHY